jgi:hypothetical protein
MGPRAVDEMASLDQFDHPRVLCAMDGGGSNGT